MKNIKLIFSASITLLIFNVAMAQDIPQPPANYGLTSVLDGAPPGKGLYLLEYFSYYSGVLQDVNGNDVKPNGTDDLGVSSALLMNQLFWVTDAELLGGNLLFDVLVPIVNIDTSSPYDLVGRSGLGDIIVGTGVQWFNKKLFGLPYFHRFEVDFVLPVGSYNNEMGSRPINAGSRFLTIQPYYSQTLFFNDKFSASLRHHLSFNSQFKEIPNVNVKAGTFYHMIYSLEHLIGKKRFNPGVSGETRFAIHGYYGSQLNDDQANGVDVPDSRESVFAIGPNLHFITKKGFVIGIKAAFETAVKNRPKGIRSTIRIIKYWPSKGKKNKPIDAD